MSRAAKPAQVQPAAFLRTTLPLGISQLETLDSGRYHSLWLPDHLVSFWPDSIWTPEFTDLATTSPSPHRHLDAIAVAAAAAVLTKNVPIATAVVDTVRRHPVMLAQSALTLDHLSRGRFILGLGTGEKENLEPYGFDFSKPIGRFEEAVRVIRLLWESDGPIDFEGRFFRLHRARLDTEPYEGRVPQIWVGGNSPRMLDITGRLADGWWTSGSYSPEDYAGKLERIRESAERAGRDPMAIVPAFIVTCLIGDEDELAEILAAPLVKALVMHFSAALMREYGYAHPLGPDWRGYHDIDPHWSRERILAMLERVDVRSLRALVPHGTPQQVARVVKGFCDAGLRVPKILDYGGMAGLAFAARSPQKVRETEDELLRLVGGGA